MLKVWSNGRFCNVKHRTVQGSKSIASFFLGPKEAAVEAPPELVDSENPRQFVSFTYEDYRKLRLSINLHAGEALQFARSHSWSTGMPCISTAFIRIYLLTQLWWSVSLDIKQISQFFFFIIVNCYWCIIKVMLMAGAELGIFVWGGQVATLIYLSRQPHTHT